MKYKASAEQREGLKKYLKSGDLEKAMYIANCIGFHGIAAKLARQKKQFELAGKFYNLFRDYTKSLDCYLQSDKKYQLGEVVDVARKTNDAKNVLKAIEFMIERANPDQSEKHRNIYLEFKYGKYDELDNYEETITKVKKNYLNEILENNENCCSESIPDLKDGVLRLSR